MTRYLAQKNPLVLPSVTKDLQFPAPRAYGYECPRALSAFRALILLAPPIGGVLLVFLPPDSGPKSGLLG